MNPGADRLPIDVLEKIFSYLPCEDLVESVQFVCTWWQQVSREKGLWKHIMYQPDAGTKDVIQRLKITPQLRILNLKSATVDNNLIQFITDSCPNLEHLVVHWDSIYNNSDVTITRPLSQIKILRLFSSADSSSLDFLYLDRAFPNLESLNIAEMSFNRKDLEQYLEKKQDSLHTFSLPCYTDDELCVLSCLSVCTKLRNLSLYVVCDNVRSWKEFGYLPNISHLELHHTKLTSVKDSSTVFCIFPNITELVLECCDSPTENDVCIIACNCPQLQKLKFSYFCLCGTSNMVESDEELQIDHILKDTFSLEKLTHLYIHNSLYVDDKRIEHLRLMPQLIHLDLYKCEFVTTGCLKLICGFSKLEVLKFDLQNEALPADLTASDVKNKNLQLMFYNCQDVSSLDSLRRQHLRVCLIEYSCIGQNCSYACRKVYCTCWFKCYYSF